MVGIGLMSGTSLDGVDAALVRIDGPTHATLLDFVTRPYDNSERAECPRKQQCSSHACSRRELVDEH